MDLKKTQSSAEMRTIKPLVTLHFINRIKEETSIIVFELSLETGGSGCLQMCEFKL